MNRRQFIKQAACGTAAIVIGSRLPFFPSVARAAGPTNLIELGMTTADVEMVDGILVPHWVYTVNNRTTPTLPGPVIFAYADESFTIRVHNDIDDGRSRRFAIVGRDANALPKPNPFAHVKESAPISFGQNSDVTINAGDLQPGTYFYKDPTLDPVSRVLGLHGALIILPANSDPVKNNPYGSFCNPYPNVKQLFADLGSGTPLRGPNALFPGDPWFATTADNPNYKPNIIPPKSDADWYHRAKFIHAPTFEKFYYRTRVWLHTSIDPVLNRWAIDNITPPAPIPAYDITDPVAVRDNHLPQYFSINGRQGAYCSNSHDITLAGTVGQPHLVRMINVGLLTQAPHFHANHVYPVADNNVIGGFVHYVGTVDAGQVFDQDNVVLVDTITLGPQSRYDLVFPFIRPPDIPRVTGNDGQLLPLTDMLQEELEMVLGGVPQDPLTYPMHCHTEMAQTAAGGNYPQGQVVHLEIFGEFGKFFKPRKYAANVVPRITPLLLNE